MPKIHVLHENGAWLDPLREAFAEMRLPYEEWFLDTGRIDLSATPPAGVFYNRMSASSHTRDHRFAPELTSTVLAWLAAHGRPIVNGPAALDLEISKARQYALLARHGIAVPPTVVAVGPAAIMQAASRFAGRPFLLKPNRGGTGAGIHRFDDAARLARHLSDPSQSEPVDGIHLVQAYVEAPEPTITRAEFIGGRFLYAVRVDTSGGFDLCPADACALPDPAKPKFTIVDNIPDALRRRYETFLADAGIDVAGIEFVTDANGVAWTYDVNTNTNYNGEAEARAGIAGTDQAGMRALARHLGDALAQVTGRRAAA